MNDITVFFLVPTKNSKTNAQQIINHIIPMFGTLNCEQKDDTCALQINYVVSKDQQSTVAETIKPLDYECIFIISPMDTDRVEDNQIDLHECYNNDNKL